mmetsp:Transcript_44554/g.83471  ORF Transcript_44554/g.83471 Transcript_44554/m.83471 type:complete len:296 (-) Transcript_44554:84-971(-)
MSNSTSALPADVFCPICLKVMYDDPVMCSDGHTYDRECIQRWFSMGRYTSPKTNETLESKHLTPNITLRNTIQELVLNLPENQWKELRGSGQPLKIDCLSAEEELDLRYATTFYKVVVINGSLAGQELVIEVDSGCDLPAYVIRERVAEEVSKSDVDSYDECDSTVSRIRLKLNGIELNYQEPNLRPNSSLTAEIVQDDWQDIVSKWPNDDLRQMIENMSTKPSPHDPDVLFGSTPEFSEIVRNTNSLRSGKRTRGAQNQCSDEISEILEVLHEAQSGARASPASVLQALKDEFG